MTACTNKTSTCGPGLYRIKSGPTNRTHDDRCEACVEGTFKAGRNGDTACGTKTTECDAGFFFTDTG